MPFIKDLPLEKQLACAKLDYEIFSDIKINFIEQTTCLVCWPPQCPNFKHESDKIRCPRWERHSIQINKQIDEAKQSIEELTKQLENLSIKSE